MMRFYKSDKGDIEVKISADGDPVATHVIELSMYAAQLGLTFEQYLLFRILGYVEGMAHDVKHIEDRLAYMMDCPECAGYQPKYT